MSSQLVGDTRTRRDVPASSLENVKTEQPTQIVTICVGFPVRRHGVDGCSTLTKIGGHPKRVRKPA
jgi:hypothetical protein